MKLNMIFTCVVVALLWSSCGNVYHWSDHDESTEFGAYSTYSIDEQCSDYNPGVNPINQQRIKNAIEFELRKMGYTKSDDADLQVKYFIKNETKYFREECLPEYDQYEGGRYCVDRIYDYEVGTLVIDLLDIKDSKAVWHGGAESKSWDDLDNPDREIKRMVASILSDYKTLKEN